MFLNVFLLRYLQFLQCLPILILQNVTSTNWGFYCTLYYLFYFCNWSNIALNFTNVIASRLIAIFSKTILIITFLHYYSIRLLGCIAFSAEGRLILSFICLIWHRLGNKFNVPVIFNLLTTIAQFPWLTSHIYVVQIN